MISGPEATAGSTFILWKNNGTKVPTRLEIIIETNNDIPTQQAIINALNNEKPLKKLM